MTVAATWPASLPQELTIDGEQIDLPQAGVRVPMDAGPQFQRQRFTAATTPVQGSMWMTKTQYTTFLDFWTNALGMGTEPFNWVHPITGAAVVMQFRNTDPPKVDISKGIELKVSMQMDILP